MAPTQPTKLHLAQTPTPLEYLEHSSSALGVEFYIKRDDLTGLGLSGNKVRKLEFLLAEATSQNAQIIITCGGEQSNHCRATAVAAAKLGLRSLLFLRTKDPSNPPTVTGNILLNKMVNAEIRWISYEEYGRRNELMNQAAAKISSQGKTTYIIPEGGSNALGSWGYIQAAKELDAQLKTLAPAKSTSIVYACGSGGTGAGLILGGKIVGFEKQRIQSYGINVCDSRDYFIGVMGEIFNEFHQRFGEKIEAPINIIDGYVGRGYAKSTPEELRCIQAFASREGIFLDPVYSGKAYFGLVNELRKKPEIFGERIIFLHTGGIYGLFAKAADLNAICDEA